MNVRSLVTLVVVFALVTAAVWVAQLNRQPVTVTIPGFVPFAAPLWAVLFLTLLTGIFLALVYSLAMTSREAVTRWRHEREGRPARDRAARLERGLRLLIAGDDAAARQELGALVEEQPGNAEAWLFAGTAARRSGDPDAALEMHLRALGLLPDDDRVLAELSLDAEAAGDSRAAVRYQQRLLESAGRSPERQRRLRDLHLAANRLDAAIDAQRQLEETGSGAEPATEPGLLAALRVERARRRLESGEAAGAIAAAREVLADRPGYEPAYALLVDGYEGQRDLGATLEAYEEAFEATRSLEMLRRHANLLVETEEPEEAIRTLRAAVGNLDGAPRIAARILLGRLYYRLELVDEAWAEFRDLQEVVESSPLVNYYQGKLHARRGEHAAAYELLKESILATGVLDLSYRCPECDTVGPTYGERCHDRCRHGRLEMEVGRHARPARPVEAPAV